MERRQLEYFLAVVDHGGFVKAAAALHVTQPALSQAISHLERELGVQLFHRVGRGVRPTAAAAAIEGPSRQTIDDFAAVRSAVQAVVGLEAGQLDIATLPTLAQEPGTKLVGAFHRKYPGVRLRLRGLEQLRIPGIAEMVRRGDCEIGLTESGAITDDLAVDHLQEQDYVALLPPGTLASTDGVVDLDFVLDLGLVVGPWWETSKPRIAIEALLPNRGDDYVVVRTQYRETLLPLVAAGVGATLVPGFVAEMVKGTDTIVVETRPPISRQVVLAHRKEPLSPAAAAFRELALAELPPRLRLPRRHDGGIPT